MEALGSPEALERAKREDKLVIVSCLVILLVTVPCYGRRTFEDEEVQN